jgi:hypothetical protein
MAPSYLNQGLWARTMPWRAPLVSKQVSKSVGSGHFKIGITVKKSYFPIAQTREEHRLRVFENRVLKRIFGPKRDELTGDWRKLLHNLYSSPNIIRMIKSRRMKWAGHVARIKENRNAYRILVGKPEGERPLGRPRSRWVDNIKIDLREIGWNSVDWVDLAQDRDQWRALVNTVVNLRVP